MKYDRDAIILTDNFDAIYITNVKKGSIKIV